MRKRYPARTIAQFAIFSLAIAAANGCQMMHPSAPVAVTVLDAETKTPVPGAQVAFLYPTSDSSEKTRDITGTTNASGVAQISGVSTDDGLPQVRITAPGYVLEQSGLPGSALHSIKENNSFWSSFSSHRDPVELPLYVFHGPSAAIELTVPAGYRGMIKVDVRIREDITYPRDQRVFTGTLADGAVQVDGSPLLRSEYKPVYRARYSDDTPVPMNVQDNEVGFRWLRTEGRTELFVIGTRAEWEGFRRATDKAIAADASGKKSGGSGGGGGGRRGGGGGGSGGMGGSGGGGQ
ncbi:MAG TPA: hypothetical protein VG097_01350 [Gemmata sp.]|nr:hypothetical protein [Gemmata sp.]